MKRYRVECLATGEAASLTLDDAEALTGVDRDEIVSAIEEEGVCETDEFAITAYEAAPAAGPAT